jgi:hypothetical protein
MFNFFRKRKGCLYYKTPIQKTQFFKSLAEFAKTDEQFFIEQYDDLLPNEKKEFQNFLLEESKRLNIINELLKIIEKIK